MGCPNTPSTRVLASRVGSPELGESWREIPAWLVTLFSYVIAEEGPPEPKAFLDPEDEIPASRKPEAQMETPREDVTRGGDKGERVPQQG